MIFYIGTHFKGEIEMKIIYKLMYFLFFLPILVSYSQSDSLIVSEVMFYPSASNSEFIEIFNLSHQNSVDLSKYQIIYSSANADTITETGDGILLPARSFAVIFEGDYDLENGIYSTMVPEGSIKLQIQDNAFGSSGMANTSNRTILLVNSIGDTVDAHTYSAKNSAGISDEKILLNPDTSLANWANSLTLNGTPGKENSVSPRRFDLSVANINYSPLEIYEGDKVNFTSSIKNIGTSTCENFTAFLFVDINKDSSAQQNEIIISQNFSTLLPNDSTELIGQSNNLPVGKFDFYVTVDFTLDEQLLNNTHSVEISINPKLNNYNDIIISELMFAPTDNEPEWIEIYNRSDFAINLSNWRIADKVSSIIIYDSTLLIQSQEFLVLTDDETIYDHYDIPFPVIVINLPSLNNSGDNIKLLDSLKREIDSVNYSNSWGREGGNSLEKINLDENSNDSTNWGSSLSPFGGTPGKVNSITPKENDLIINRFFTENDFVFIGESIKLNATVVNIGTKTSKDYSVQIFHDTNSDSVAQENEFVNQFSETGLVPLDSTELSLEISDFNSGLNYFIAKIIYEGDENVENNISYLNFVGVEINEVRNDIVINEIMYTPKSPEPEWIELYNRSDKTINLKNYQIADKTDTTQVVENDLLFQPHQYFVIADDSSFLSVYSDTINFIISSFPNLNNDGDNLIILDSLNRVIDSLSFDPTWGGTKGVSMERKDSELPSIDSTNWSSSKLASGGTPGELNSITPREFDLSINHFFTESDFVINGETAKLIIIVQNIGTQFSGNYSLQIYHDINTDSIAQEIEFKYQYSEIGLAPNDSTELILEFSDYFSGKNHFIAKLIYDEDGNVENNISYLSFIGVEINEIRNDLIINEIMYAPNSPEPEWVELYNRSDKIINLKNYQIADKTDTTKVIENDLIFQPYQYFVIADDSSFLTVYNDTMNFEISAFPNLNNTGDKLIILDSLNRVMDSLYFNSNWGGKSGVSLERIDIDRSSIDSTNWSSSKLDSGGTPGIINSISQRDYDVKISQLNFEPRFPISGEQVRINVMLKNVGKNRITCFLQLLEDVDLDSVNFLHLESTNLVDINTGDSLNIELQYVVDSIKEERAFLVEAVSDSDQDTSNNKMYKAISPGYSNNIIVINEIMYSPVNGEPEWIELLNTTNEEVNLKNWVVSDIYTTPKISEITDQNLLIQANGYFVLAKDSTIWDYHKNISSPVLISSFANLNNDIDGVVLKDQYRNMIDSVEFKYSWGGTSGYSLERKSYNLASNDSTNWDSSIGIELSTPGGQNSITPKNYDLKLTSIFTSPGFPTIFEDVYINAVAHNIGVNALVEFSVIVETIKNGILSELESFNNLSLESGDSLALRTNTSFVLDDSTRVIAKIIADLDNDSTNNTYSIVIYPSFMKNSIVINEFMASPNTEEAEWVELYNNSSNQINIKKWSISDLFSSPTKNLITENDVIVSSGEFIIITSDTSKYSSIGDVKIIEANFGTLGNIDDGILLYDFNSKVIDSLHYDKEWEIEKGRSVERVDFDEPSYESYNWLPSLSITGSTPGTRNSILETQPYSSGDIKINEIMYDPDNDNSEFIELYNNTDSPIDIGGWNLFDGSNNYFELSETFFELNPSEYFIYAADSSILDYYSELQNNSAIIISNTGDLSLSNDEEIIMIMDHWGNVIDSIDYSSKWHNKNLNITKNKSLERINPNLDGNDKTNWSTSVDPIGATPIKKNSIYTEGETSEAKLSFSPNPFSPDNDGYEDFTLISYNLSVNTAQIRIKIFDDEGRLVRTLVNNKPSSSQGTEIFDGLDDSGNPLRIGMYIVFIEASNSTSGVVDVLKDVIVIARKL